MYEKIHYKKKKNQSGVFGNTLMENHNTGPWSLEQGDNILSIEIYVYMLFRNSLLITVASNAWPWGTK